VRTQVCVCPRNRASIIISVQAV